MMAKSFSLSFFCAFLSVFIHIVSSALVNIPQPNGNVLTYPAQCVTQADRNQIRAHCSRWAAADGLAYNAGSRGWSVDECETHYCSSLTIKAPAEMLPQCTQSTCIKYKLGVRAGTETWLNPRLIKIFGTKMRNPVPYVFPYLMFSLRGTTINNIIKERFLIIEFSAPDWGDLTEVQIFFDRQQIYQSLKPKPWFLNTGVEYVWMAKGHYNYWWNIGGQKVENAWIKPRTVSKEWRYNDLIDPKPVCYGRGLCGDPWPKYGYQLAYPSYQERWYMSEINGIRNNPRDYYKKALNNRDSTRIKCGIDGSHPYFYDTRMGQGARFKAWENGAGLCPGSGHFTCPQHIPWICRPGPDSCANVAGRTNIMSKDPCLNGFCTPDSESPVGSAVGGRADGVGFRFKAEGLGGHIGLIESDPGHCGGVLGNIRYRTAFGWFPNVRDGARTWEPFKGSTAVNGPFPKQNTWWPNNAVYMKYNPIPTGSHKVIAEGAGGQAVRYLVTYWSRTNVAVRNGDVYVVINGGGGIIGDASTGGGGGGASGSTNLALGKPTAQSSTGYRGVSSRAVDGNTNGAWSGKSCTHTNTETNPWWYVDLGSSQSVTSVALTNRADCCSNRLADFEIFVAVGKPGAGFVPVASEICASSAASFSGTKTFSCTTQKSGRYVGVIIKKRQVLTLCEVQVFGPANGPTTTVPPLPSVPSGIRRQKMTLLVGTSKYGTYKYEETYPVSGSTCRSYYFEIYDSSNKRYLMPESGMYVYQTWGVGNCRNDFKVDLCARVGFNACGANGQCNPRNGKCTCSNNYKGNKCQNAPNAPSACAGVNCGAFGTCSTTTGQCQCSNGYVGPSCEIPGMGMGAGDHGTINNQMFNNPVNMAAKTGSGQPVPGAATSGSQPTANTGTSGTQLNSGAIAGIVIGAAVGLCLLGLVACWCTRQARVKKSATKDYEMMKNQGGEYRPPQEVA